MQKREYYKNVNNFKQIQVVSELKLDINLKRKLLVLKLPATLYMKSGKKKRTPTKLVTFR
jgi:hypothetical protein